MVEAKSISMEACKQNHTFLDLWDHLHLLIVYTSVLKSGECHGFGVNLQPKKKRGKKKEGFFVCC